MKSVEWGAMIAARRREAGLTQAELAERMGTAQSAISRVEAGRTLPSIAFLERFAAATGGPMTVVFGQEQTHRSRKARRERVRRVLGSYRFNPWERAPTPAEARTLIADGLTRERLDDLYLDRLRQATIDERREGIEFQSALAMVAARYEDIDWPYIRGRIVEISESEGSVGGLMKRLDSRIRRRVRQALSGI